VTGDVDDCNLVIAITPFEEPNARLAVAAARAGGMAILDLGRDAGRAHGALADMRRLTAGSSAGLRIGVRIPVGCPISPAQLDAALDAPGLPPSGMAVGPAPVTVDTVVLPNGSPWTAAQAVEGGRRVFAEVTSPIEAIEAAAAGADGLIARGNEGGGWVGDQTTCMLLQALMAAPELDLPIWAAGGIGLHSAAAAVAGGAVGVVLDVQLALVSEMELPAPVAAAISAMDGSETTVIGGHRVYVRPDLPVASLDTQDPRAAPEVVALRLGASDLREQLLPIGQDGSVAAALANRHRTAGGVLLAVRQSIRDHLAAAVRSEPLAPGSRFAVANGLRLPVAQGPMTRVSDRAPFAVSVAQGGGLPFLALALMSPREVQTLLEEAAALFRAEGSDLPWGVGILGFVPAELRQAQLEVIKELRPPHALIAGGRPSQAAPLEDLGISTFLHVPSPTLLRQFVADGARKFVFEGRECGGHVGPRASFPLWDAQVDQLLACIEQSPGLAGEFQVLFAGGIHDERSSAMVAALAAPLAARGAGVGVLMGTAYLLTEEAVAGGAVLPGFQQAIVDCGRTVLLETSPGHATRCADSPYVEAFLETKQRLLAEGASRQEMWAALEGLNLGRLRIASKGQRRSGDQLVEVAEGEQYLDGMFMTGEVAILRGEVTTVEALHAQVTADATAHLADRAERAGGISAEVLPPSADTVCQHSGPLDIAIVGMACVFPQAGDLAAYWANVLGGVDTITEVALDRWNHEIYYDPDYDPAHPKPDSDLHTPSKWGGFLPRIPFDALSYGIPPNSLRGIETAQLLALDVAAKALCDAGYERRPFDRSRVSVFFGAETGTDLTGAYGFRSMYPGIGGKLPPALDAFLPRMTEDSFPGVLGNVIAGRIANRLDLGGSNYTVDAACASSLAALDAACKELRAGTSSMVLCGGADLHNSIHDYLLFASAYALSPTGRCRSFDSTADGISLGEGVGCVVLKRLADAERDGDRVYAVVKSVGGASDGRSLGLTAPRADGQRRAMERSYAMAGVSPAEVGLIEAHGTGTAVGDRTELSALTELFTEAGAPAGNCTLGSVKSQIGHTKCAAGLAGLIKATLAVYTGVRPPTLNLTRPSDSWDSESSPFCFDQKARVWLDPPAERFAGISGFGFGGTNFHAVIGGYAGAPGARQTFDQWPAELFLFHGADREEAGRELDRLASLIRANETAGRPWRLRDLARTLSVRPGPVWLALVADDLDDLAGKLGEARSQLAGAAPAPRSGIFTGDSIDQPGTVAFLFPGQGSQRPGMLTDLFLAFPAIRTHLHTGRKWAGAMFPPAAFTPGQRAAQHAAITDTRVAQPALGMADAALSDVLGSLGVRPGMTAGHSYGELVALRAAGVLDDRALLELSEARALAILAATDGTEGTMAAVTGGAEAVRSALATADREIAVVAANHNAPDQVVLSGAASAVDEAVQHLMAAGFAAKRIPVACAFHSPLVAGAADTLLAHLQGMELATPSCPVWSNATAAPYPVTAAEIRTVLAGQVAAPVRWVEQIEAMYAAGARIFVEVGPGRTLTELAGRILADRPHTVIACDVPGEHGVRRLLLSLAELATHGVPVDPAPLFSGRDATVVAETSVPRRPGWMIDGPLIRGADGAVVNGGLQPAPRESLVSLGTPGGPGPAAGTGDRDATVLEFLRSTRQLVAAQRDVVLGYLGAPIPATSGGADSALLSAALPERDGFTPVDLPGPAPAQALPVSSGSEPLSTGQLTALLLDIVSQRTGYPLDMLDPRADLEADLSIDSIKRTEILGEVAGRVSLAGAVNGAPGGMSGGMDPEVMEELAGLKTIEAIVSWIAGKLSPSAEVRPQPAAPVSVSVPVPAPAVAGDEPVKVTAGRPDRFVLAIDQLDPVAPAESDGVLAGHRFLVIPDDQGIGLAVADLLEQRRAEVHMVAPGGPLPSAERIDGMVYLPALDQGRPAVLPEAYTPLRAALLRGATRLVVATGRGGMLGYDTQDAAPDGSGIPADAGLPGLARTLSREFPEVLVRSVDVDPKEPVDTVARHILAELLQAPEAEGPVVIGRVRDKRIALRVVPAPLAGSLPALDLGEDSVVLLTGGARGITAKTAVALARATGCHLELVGRAPLPAAAGEADIAACTGSAEIRRALIARGMRIPAEIEAETRSLLTAGEIRRTLGALATVAASVRYHQADIRDAASVQAVVGTVLDRHGRLDGVIHGAGVLDDKLVRDKTPESFRHVFSTKVAGAQALADALAARDCKDLSFLVFFGSASGVFGNRGQADYSAANDALDRLSGLWADRFAGQVLSVDWGPWESPEGGMVSATLAREYDRRGIGLIDADEGAACLLRELAAGQGRSRTRDRTSQVVYLCGDPQAYEAAAAGRGSADA